MDAADPRVARLRADLVAATTIRPNPGPPPTDPALAVIHRAAGLVADDVIGHPEVVDLIDPSLFTERHRPTSANARAMFAFWVRHRLSSIHGPVEVLGWTNPSATSRTDREVTAEVQVVARDIRASRVRAVTVEVGLTRRGNRWRSAKAELREPPPPWYAPDTPSLEIPALADIVGSFRRPPEPPRNWLPRGRTLLLSIVASLAATAIVTVIVALLRRAKARSGV
jgi:hypothetical protein